MKTGVKTTCQRERDINRLQPVVSMKLPQQLMRPDRPWSSMVKCNVNGGYSSVQCHQGTPFCWCVDKYGRELPRTRTSGEPKCGPMGKYFAFNLLHFSLRSTPNLFGEMKVKRGNNVCRNEIWFAKTAKKKWLIMGGLERANSYNKIMYIFLSVYQGLELFWFLISSARQAQKEIWSIRWDRLRIVPIFPQG